MEYMVSELAKITGISGRTLRYYDQIDLLKPARINTSGYRIYEEKEVDILQQILFYRELEVSLEDIKKVITDPSFNHIEALEDHRKQLKRKQDRLKKIITTLETTIENRKGEKKMQNEAKFSGFKEKLIHDNEEKYGKEIRNKYGDDTIDASNEKLRGMNEADYNAMQKVEGEVFELLKEAKKTGDPASGSAHKLAEKHKQWLMYSWTSYSEAAHAGLAEMYVTDERFRAYYDEGIEGGAQFLRDAIIEYTKTEK